MMVNVTNYDCVVVGAGIMGCATALEVVRRGYNTLLVDKFPLPHTSGSSHGQSRLFGYYKDEPTYIKLLDDALAGFKELERLSGETLFVPTSSILIGHKNDSYINDVDSTMTQCNVPFEKLETQEMRLRLPHNVIDDNFVGLNDPQGGILLSDKCLTAYREEFQKLGGHLVDENAVTDLTANKCDPTITLVTETGQIYTTTKLVLCLGPWAGPLVKKWLDINLPVKAVERFIYYAPVTLPDAYSALQGSPNINYVLSTNEMCSGLPSYEYKDMIKIGIYSRSDSERNADTEKDEEEQRLISLMKQHWKEVEPVLAISQKCIYTMSEDRHFIIDTCKDHPNIAFASGFSGVGFKYAPVIGKILADLVTTGATKYDIGLFSMKRFETRQTN